MEHLIYRGRHTQEISFPLGGIGAGSIGLAGNGRLIDWEILNRPSKGSFNGFSHFSVRAEADGRVTDARVLNGDLAPPYSGQLSMHSFQSFGFGPPRQTMAGMPHFREVEFAGAFPIAALRFIDATFPGRVTLTAFSPFIPLNDRDSGMPVALFEFEAENSTATPLRYSFAGSLHNPLPPSNRNVVTAEAGRAYLHLASDGTEPARPGHGDLTLAAEGPELSWQQYWYRGGWFDDLEVYWRDFTTPGALRNRSYAAEFAGAGTHGTLAVHLDLAPGERGRARFVISWSFPNCENYWGEHACRCAEEAGIPNVWRNYYATQWPDSMASAREALEQWDALASGTREFRDTLFASDLPPAALDAVSANLAVLRSPTVMRLEDGTFYGWEGCHPDAGCCEGSCTHVWNYAQALPFLFPRLERSMREADYRYNLRADGGMPFRLQLPLGVPRSTFRPCADGQFGGVMKAFRDWRISGDTEWLRGLWPAVKASLEFAWSPDNEDRWDPERTGVLWGRQHHTLDMELFGPNSWLTGFYIGALRAGALMAEALGEPETAGEWRAIADRGRAWVDENLFNGRYYRQQIDLTDRAIVDRYGAPEYFSEEHGEIKYQIGDGCVIDQLLAQYHAGLYGLGDLLDRQQMQTAMSSMFASNFVPLMRRQGNTWRVFSLNDEPGLTICSWPEDARKPAIPLTYWSETMTGFEYAAAVLMVQLGLVDQGMSVVSAIRDRHDGLKRNPWNEFECGSNYARSMASYALLNAFSGFEFDMVERRIAFSPVRTQHGRFRCFWSLDAAWGEVILRPNEAELRVARGALPLRRLGLPFAATTATLGDGPVSLTVDAASADLVFDPEVTVTPEAPLRLRR